PARPALGHRALCPRQHLLACRCQGSLSPKGWTEKLEGLVEPFPWVHGGNDGGIVRLGVPRFPAASGAPVLRNLGCFQPDAALPSIPRTQADAVTSEAPVLGRRQRRGQIFPPLLGRDRCETARCRTLSGGRMSDSMFDE